VFDNGQHALMGCYRETFALLDAIGARDAVAVQPSLRLSMIDASGRPLALACPRWPAPWHLVGGVLRWHDLSIGERASLLRIAPALRRAARAAAGDGDLPCEPGETVAQWLARHGQHGRPVDYLWEPLALAALNQPLHTAAAPTFVRVLGRVFGGAASDASLALAVEPLSEVFGAPAARYLAERGGAVERHALARVIVDGARVAAVSVRGASRPASRVVLATPWFTWPRVLAGDTRPLAAIVEAARATRPSPIVTVTLTFDRPVVAGPVVGFPAQWVQWAFDVSHLGGRDPASAIEPGRRVALVVSGADEALELDEADVVRRSREVLDRAGPAARAARLLAWRVVREPRATFSLAPGQPRRPATRTPVSGLYLASDWVDTGLPATIEGAVEAGHRAAEALLADG
jgi:squalene-associated FAD-dependent desaturase